ncbi:uncharacterized protein EDB91DRAFT_1056288 [Suillus paluster]|uniref:uncharacterized protein n=1 Tax=Suillus paluster TaxID=48578 RepID=UPI001B8791C9|nr:uncharacterized protein EDB91DRAFT_1056288 [Suillus paluster]KAG1735300.1 hypothetical protein EDB91DRAFT_1056288 [Suillus paluster]
MSLHHLSSPTSQSPASPPTSLVPGPSHLRPQCKAGEQIFLWWGTNSPPPSTIDNPVIRHIASLASRTSLRDTTSYGAGLQKFHLFCDIFSIPEADHPQPGDSILSISSSTPFEPVSVGVVQKYLSAVRAWHIAQGWPPPLSKSHHDCINWSLHGLENIQISRRRPLRPPVMLSMLAALKATLVLSDPFDACVWAIVSCAFFGMMWFSKVSVTSQAAFTPSKYLTRAHAFFGVDLLGSPYACLDLPSAKTARAGEIQSVFLNKQGDLCPLAALCNLAQVVPALADDPLFSWRDSRGDIHPMAKVQALERINSILIAWGWGTSFGHSFRIGGASFYLAKKIDPEIV